jgi:hypothetical protein
VNEVLQTIDDDDLSAFSRWLEGEPYLLGESSVGLQVELLERATLQNRDRFIVQLGTTRLTILKGAPIFTGVLPGCSKCSTLRSPGPA